MSYTFEQLKDLVKTLASCLRRAGLDPGARLIAIGAESTYISVIMLATIAAGGIFAGCDPKFGAAQQSAIIRDCEPALVLAQKGADEGKIAMAMNIAGVPNARLFSWDETLFQYSTLRRDRVFERQHTLLDFRRGPSLQWKTFETEEDAESTAVIIYTSG